MVAVKKKSDTQWEEKPGGKLHVYRAVVRGKRKKEFLRNRRPRRKYRGKGLSRSDRAEQKQVARGTYQGMLRLSWAARRRAGGWRVEA